MIKNISNLLKKGTSLKGSFFANVLVLMSGTAFAQIITVVTAPVITRLFNADAFGFFTLYSTLMSIISIIICMRYEYAIVLPEDGKDAKNLFALASIFTFGMSIVAFLVILFFRNSIAILLTGTVRFASLLWLLPLSMLFAGFFQSLNYWFTRNKGFKKLAFSHMTQSFFSSTTQIGLGFLKSSGSFWLIIGQIVGQISAVFVLGEKFLKSEFHQFISQVSWDGIKKVARKYKKFPIFNTWSSVLNSLAAGLPVFFLNKAFGPQATGYYGLTLRVINIPLTLIGSSVAQAIFPKLALEKDKLGTVQRTIKTLAFLGLILFISLQLSPFLFGIVFGPEWKQAGVYARILAASMVIKFIVSPISSVLIVYDKQETLSVWQVAYVVSTIVTLYFGSHFSNPFMMIYCIVGNDILLYSIYFYLILRVLRIQTNKANS